MKYFLMKTKGQMMKKGVIITKQQQFLVCLDYGAWQNRSTINSRGCKDTMKHFEAK